MINHEEDENNSRIAAVNNINTQPPNGFPLFDALVAYAYARDLFNICDALNPEKDFAKSEHFASLEVQQRYLVQLIIKNFCQHFHRKVIVTAQSLTQCGIGNALPLLTTLLKDIETFQSKLLQRTSIRNFLTDGILGQQLFDIFLAKNKGRFLECIHSIKTSRKFSETQLIEIDQILIAFKSDHDLFKVELPRSEISDWLEQRAHTINEITEQFNLQQVKIANLAFNELMKVNQTVERFQLLETEIQHLAYLLKDYFSLGTQDLSPNLTQMMFSLDKIKPIFNLNVSDYWQLIDDSCLYNKGSLIVKNFKDASAQVYKTYEGIGLATNAYLEAIETLDNIIVKLRLHKVVKESVIEQVAKYKECFENYFQLSMRFVMPLNEFTAACKKIQERLSLGLQKCKDQEESKTEASSSEKIQLGNISKVKELMKVFEEMIPSLAACSDLLRQKTLTINALKDITVFIKKIKEFNEAPDEFSILPFFKPMDYKPVLNDILTYFMTISQSSRTEGHTNYRAILDQINLLLAKHNIVLSNKNLKKCSGGEALLVEIHQRYTENLKKYQEDHHIIQGYMG